MNQSRAPDYILLAIFFAQGIIIGQHFASSGPPSPALEAALQSSMAWIAAHGHVFRVVSSCFSMLAIVVAIYNPLRDEPGFASLRLPVGAALLSINFFALPAIAGTF